MEDFARIAPIDYLLYVSTVPLLSTRLRMISNADFEREKLDNGVAFVSTMERCCSDISDERPDSCPIAPRLSDTIII